MLTLYHDWGSAGNAGVFSFSFLKYFTKTAGPTWLFVHKYYPSSGRRIFRTFGYLENARFHNITKMAQVTFTLGVMLSIVWSRRLFGCKTRVLINIYQPFLFYYVFACACPRGCCIPIVHDVQTHENSMPTLLQVAVDKFLGRFHCLLLSRSSLDLLRISEIKTPYILPFPLYDSSPFCGSTQIVDDQHLRICFLGHLRREKGIELVLRAVKGLHLKKVSVTIHGTNPFGYDVSVHEYPAVQFIPDFVPSKEYYEYLKSFDYCLLMYDDSVSNSGVLFDCLSVGVKPITSKAPLFTKSALSSHFEMCSGDQELRKFILKLDSDSSAKTVKDGLLEKSLESYSVECYRAYEEFRREIF